MQSFFSANYALVTNTPQLEVNQLHNYAGITCMIDPQLLFLGFKSCIFAKTLIKSAFCIPFTSTPHSSKTMF